MLLVPGLDRMGYRPSIRRDKPSNVLQWSAGSREENAGRPAVYEGGTMAKDNRTTGGLTVQSLHALKSLYRVLKEAGLGVRLAGVFGITTGEREAVLDAVSDYGPIGGQDAA